MDDRPARGDPERKDSLARLHAALLEWDPPLEVIAEDVLGLGDERIDGVACDPEGRIWLVGCAEPGDDLRTLASLLAQRSWLAPRLADWHKLAPGLRLDPEQPACALLVAADFDPRTRALAADLADPRLALARLLRPPHGARLDLWLEPVDGPARPARQAGFAPAEAAGFRTGLRDEDLALAAPGAASGSEIPRGRRFSSSGDDF